MQQPKKEKELSNKAEVYEGKKMEGSQQYLILFRSTGPFDVLY